MLHWFMCNIQYYLLFQLNMCLNRKMMFVCVFLILSFSVVGVSGDAADMQIVNKLNVKLDENLEQKSDEIDRKSEDEQSSPQSIIDKKTDEISKKLKKLVDKAVFQIIKEQAASTSKTDTNSPIPITNAPTSVPLPANIPKYIPGNVPGYAGPIYLPIQYPPPQMNEQNQPASYQQTQSKGMDKLLKNFERYMSLSHNMLVKVESHPPCDSYEEVTRTCWIDKQLGRRVKLRPKFYDMQGKELDSEDLRVSWHKHYKVYKSTEITEKEITDNFEESNLEFGSNRAILNLKPLEDEDMDFNSFVLTVRFNPSSANGDMTVLAKMRYRFRILPIDMGFVNDGESLYIDIRNYITLPKEEVILDWFIERGNEEIRLPSNMDVNENGQILTVTEFQNRRLSTVIVCSIYDKKTGMFHAKRRFKIRSNPIERKLNRQSSSMVQSTFKPMKSR